MEKSNVGIEKEDIYANLKRNVLESKAGLWCEKIYIDIVPFLLSPLFQLKQKKLYNVKQLVLTRLNRQGTYNVLRVDIEHTMKRHSYE